MKVSVSTIDGGAVEMGEAGGVPWMRTAYRLDGGLPCVTVSLTQVAEIDAIIEELQKLKERLA